MTMIRQGDVLLIRVGDAQPLPQGAKLMPLEHGRIVLARGEVTGHCHAIADHGISAEAAQEIVDAALARAGAQTCNALLYEIDGERELMVYRPVILRHEEHAELRVEPGRYLLPVQMEYDASMMQRVQD